MSTNFEELVTLGLVYSEIFGGICRIFPFFCTPTQISHVISRITGQKFTKFLQNVGQIYCAANVTIGFPIFQSV